MKNRSRFLAATLTLAASLASGELSAVKKGWNGSLYWEPSMITSYKYHLVDTTGDTGITTGIFDNSDFKFNWIGVGAGVGYVAHNGFGGSLDVDFISSHKASEASGLCVDDSVGSVGSVECSKGYGYSTSGVSSLGLMATGKYYFMAASKRAVPFVEFGVGVQNITYHTDTIADLRKTESNTLPVSDSISSYSPTLMIGGGALVNFRENVNFLVSYDYRKSFESPLSSDYTVSQQPANNPVTVQQESQIRIVELGSHIFKVGVVVNFDFSDSATNNSAKHA